MDIAARFRVPLVVSYHGWDAHIAPPPGRLRLYERQHLRRRPRLFAEAALVLAASAALRDRVIALGSDPARTEVHHLGIDRAIFDGARRDAGARRIAMVGRLVRSKGIHFALEALRLLRPAPAGGGTGDPRRRAGTRQPRAPGGRPAGDLPRRRQPAGRPRPARALPRPLHAFDRLPRPCRRRPSASPPPKPRPWACRSWPPPPAAFPRWCIVLRYGWKGSQPVIERIAQVL